MVVEGWAPNDGQVTEGWGLPLKEAGGVCLAWFSGRETRARGPRGAGETNKISYPVI